jgi:UDP-MurNAc hydroxylase
MRFEILSHASMFIEHRGRSVLIDPWLKGSAYWRSWWNFPPVDADRVASLRSDFIYLTHLHWDHFHGPSLRAFDRATPILVVRDRYTRMRRDLEAMGFTNVIELPHAKPFALGDDFQLTPYLFSPLGDSAVVVASQSTTLLNANDCKIVGLPLTQLLRRYPAIDFAFRSHSSANSRVLYQALNEQLLPDDSAPPQDHREGYLQSFANFMAAVRPRFAIPFASNHCHLHRDTFKFNEWIVSPLDVEQHFASYRKTHQLSTEVRVMLPGSSWDEDSGFNLAPVTAFEDRTRALAALADTNKSKLDAAYDREARATISIDDFEKFFGQVFQHCNWLVRRVFNDGPILIQTVAGETREFWRVDVWHREVRVANASDFARADARIIVPTLVLKHAMRANMFGHVSISKRITYQATTAAMKRLSRFELLLCFEESEIIPIHNLFTWRTIASYLTRWREIVLYIDVAYLRFVRRMSFQSIEQHLLAREAAGRIAPQPDRAA